MSPPLVVANHLTVSYRHPDSDLIAVNDVGFTLERGKTLGVVGESGCGKSTLALALIGLLPKEESRLTAETLSLDGQDVRALDNESWRALRGSRVAMIFQDPFSALNPVMTIGAQLTETLALDGGGPSKARALEQLARVRLDEPERLFGSYPHQISGGQRQRVLIAIALARKPSLLIADEPTTALDVTVQDEIVTLLKDLQKDLGMAMIFVTHNIGLLQQVSDDVAVMYAGEIVERGSTTQVLSTPRHPYTHGLLRSTPTLRGSREPLPVLEGQPPELAHRPTGCAFHPRCAERFAPCDNLDPVERPAFPNRVRCHLYPE